MQRPVVHVLNRTTIIGVMNTVPALTLHIVRPTVAHSFTLIFFYIFCLRRRGNNLTIMEVPKFPTSATGSRSTRSSHLRKHLRDAFSLDDQDQISATIAIHNALDEARALADEAGATWQSFIQDLEDHAQRIETRQNEGARFIGQTLCRHGALRRRTKHRPGPQRRCQDSMLDVDVEWQQGKETVATMECFICQDDIPLPQLIKLECGHHYCVECLERRFTPATNDQVLYPPECCNVRVSQRIYRSCFGKQVVKDHESKRENRTTTDPVYCSSDPGRKFLPPRMSSLNYVVCPTGATCHQVTCLKCRNDWRFR